MAVPALPITPLAAGCNPPDVVDLSQRLARIMTDPNLAGGVANLAALLLTHYDDTALSRYVDSGGTGPTSPMYQPPIRIELTGDMTNNAGVWTATAKLLEWASATYSVTGLEFTLTDIFDKWHHALTGHRGYLGYDKERLVLIPLDLNSPNARRGTISPELGEDGVVTFTDMDDGTELQAIGTFVRATKQAPDAAVVSALWYPQAFYSGGSGGDGAWIVNVVKPCLGDVV